FVINWTFDDGNGNIITVQQNVVVEDTEAPTIPVLPVLTDQCMVTVSIPTTEDSCSGTIAATTTDPLVYDDQGNFTITWNFDDGNGNSIDVIQQIVISDTEAPEFTSSLPSSTLEVECDAIPEPEELTATDNCGDVTISVNDVIREINDNCPNSYIIERTWTANDGNGSSVSHTQLITVKDTKAPVPTTVFDEELDVSCTDIPEIPELEFTDNCSSNITKSFIETSTYQEDVFEDYQIVRTWIVRDECMNEATYTQTLNVALDEFVFQIDAGEECFDDGIIDLNGYLPSDMNLNGTWEMLQGDIQATLNGNIFDPSNIELSFDFLPDDGGIDYLFRYTTTNVNEDYNGESIAGCTNVFEVSLNINADCVVLPCGQKDVVVSKAITPNGDAFNENFEIAGIELCGFTYQVKIFNRWGALVYESDDYQNDWNASSSSSAIGTAGKLPNGTYYYIINIKDSGLEPFTGPVYIGTK
ncbi:gliding motility-associated C-terminal domain-containing protein, partial [Seonamhaeicola marinus]